MNKTLYLHMGFHKTGTTSLQCTFAQNNDALLYMGLLYPTEYLIDFQHMFLWILILNNKTERLKKVLTEIKNKADIGKHDVLLSCEKLQMLSTEDRSHVVKIIHDVFSPSHKIEIICYLRRQDQFFESFYSQCIKQGVVTSDSDEFFEDVKDSMDYFKILSDLKDLNIINKFHTRVYAKNHIINNDIIDDFCNILQLDVNNLQKAPHANKSLDKHVFAFKKHMNHHLKDIRGKLHNSIAGIMQDASTYNDKHADSKILSSLELKLICSYFNNSNTRLFDEFQLNMDSFPEDTHTNKLMRVNATKENSIPAIMAHMIRYFDYRLYQLKVELEELINIGPNK